MNYKYVKTCNIGTVLETPSTIATISPPPSFYMTMELNVTLYNTNF